MKDVFEAFKEITEMKGLLYVASKLGHNTTSIIERWIKEGAIPESRQMRVFNFLKSEKKR